MVIYYIQFHLKRKFHDDTYVLCYDDATCRQQFSVCILCAKLRKGKKGRFMNVYKIYYSEQVTTCFTWILHAYKDEEIVLS